MAGAVIPDDWDEVTYSCQKVRWPASEQWRALLMGQITEPEKDFFWDEETGSVDDAIAAVKEAEELSLPGYWTEYCDEVIPVSAFWAYQSTPQALLAGSWAILSLDTMRYSYNDPDFYLPRNSHEPDNADLLGLWHYDVSVRFTSFSTLFMRAMQYPGNVQLATYATNDAVTQFSFDAPHLVVGNRVWIEVWSTIAQNLSAGMSKVKFNGHFVGPLD